MTISEKQLQANRLNAQKSTGPKTVEGKNVSSQNAVKHGLFAGNTVINSPYLKEDPGEYELLVTSLFNELKPASLLQEHLVGVIADTVWRRRRLVSAETALISGQLQEIDDCHTLAAFRNSTNETYSDLNVTEYIDRLSESELRQLQYLTGLRTVPTGLSGQVLLRYETRLDRQLVRAFKLLRLLQGPGLPLSPPSDPDETQI
jgi:hypothetical protein